MAPVKAYLHVRLPRLMTTPCITHLFESQQNMQHRSVNRIARNIYDHNVSCGRRWIPRALSPKLLILDLRKAKGVRLQMQWREIANIMPLKMYLTMLPHLHNARKLRLPRVLRILVVATTWTIAQDLATGFDSAVVVGLLHRRHFKIL
jgi:hypothetical protein